MACCSAILAGGDCKPSREEGEFSQLRLGGADRGVVGVGVVGCEELLLGKEVEIVRVGETITLLSEEPCNNGVDGVE